MNYICGFLNMNGGKILFGINDDGLVKGINLPRKEFDTLQINMDVHLRNFIPQVFPD